MTETRTPSRRGRGLKWALALSLALNLLILGFVGGAAWRFAGPGAGDRRWAPAPVISGILYVRALPREAQRELGREVRKQTADLPNRRERRAAFRQMLTLLRAQDFDAEAARAILSQQAAEASRVQAVAQDGWLDIVMGMSVAERAEVADRLERGLKRRHDKGPDDRR